MTEQLAMFEGETSLKTKDLYKDSSFNKKAEKTRIKRELKLTPLEHRLATLFKTVGLGLNRSLLTPQYIMSYLDIEEKSQVRVMVNHIKKSQLYQFIIQNDPVVRYGKRVFVYYIPFVNEIKLDDDNNMKRWKSSTKANVMNKPTYLDMMYAYLNELKEELDISVQGQTKAKFDSYTPHDVHRTAEAYIKTNNQY